MVNCQVKDILTKFSELEELEKNDWKVTPPSPIHFKSKVKI